jgi:dipeptidyl aminopeptidase/acylaminoacyl peptidase
MLICFSFSNCILSQVITKENLVYDGMPVSDINKYAAMLKYLDVAPTYFADYFPGNNGMLVTRREGSVSQLFWIYKAGEKGKQLSFDKEPTTGILCSPDSVNLKYLFSRDIGGNENYQIYLHDIGTNTDQLLTDGKSRNTGYRFNKKGNKILYCSNKRNSKDNDVYMITLSDKKNSEQLVFTSTQNGTGVSDWSDDEKTIIIKEYVSATESKIFLYDIESKTTKQINPSAEKIAYGDIEFTHDGKGIYYVSDEGAEFLRLTYYDIATGKTTVITKNLSWSVEGISINHDGTKLVFTTNEEGLTKLYELNQKNLSYNSIAVLDYSVLSSVRFHPNKNELGMMISAYNLPGDVFTVTLKNKADPVRWTVTETDLDLSLFVKPELIRYETFDSDGQKDMIRKIPAFIYRPVPKPNERKKPSPVLINIHGGPEAQTRPFFSPFIQYLVNELGITVITPNVRGSTGYGKTYTDLDNGYKREDAVKDIGKLLDWIATQPQLDPKRVSVWGGSYGGYMTLACMTHFNDRLRCGIDVVGISNFVTFMKKTSAYRVDLRRVEYGDERDEKMKAFMEKISPSNNVNKITKPMFIVQGANDPRVPETEASQMVAALRKNNVNCWYLLAKDEGHGFKKKENVDAYYSSLIEFLTNNLLN